MAGSCKLAKQEFMPPTHPASSLSRKMHVISMEAILGVSSSVETYLLRRVLTLATLNDTSKPASENLVMYIGVRHCDIVLTALVDPQVDLIPKKKTVFASVRCYQYEE